MLAVASSALFAYERIEAEEGAAGLVERIVALEAQNDELRSQLAGGGETLADAIGGLESRIANHSHDGDYAEVFHDHDGDYAYVSHDHDIGFTSYARETDLSSLAFCVNRAFSNLVFALQYDSYLPTARC